jgi:diguanylate cyclase (GGDEF)-like protein
LLIESNPFSMFCPADSHAEGTEADRDLTGDARVSIDLATLFLLTVDIEAMLGLLLLFVWVQNIEVRAVAWWGSAHLLRALSIALYGTYGSVPDFLSIGLADAILFGSYAATWSGTRVFGGRQPLRGSLLGGAAMWLLASQFSGFATAADLRALLSSAIVASFMWLISYELWRDRSEWLISRWPAIFIFFAQGALFLLRAPFSLLSSLPTGSGPDASAWLTVISTESLLGTISSAFIFVAMTKESRELARYDNVTGLANRFLFRRRLNEQVKQLSDHEQIAVHCFDLDRFKDVNNAFGHLVGDHLLRAVAARLKGALRKKDSLSRFGSDEFIILQPSIAGAGQAAALGKRLTEIIRQPFQIDRHKLVLTASVGTVVGQNDGEDADRLLKNADIALQYAKAEGRGAHHLFTPEMEDRLNARRSLEVDLRSALSHDEFAIVYQPIINLRTSEIGGFEALLRWNHPKLGLLLPGEFMHLAEDTELILPIGEWLLRQSCSDAARWPRHWKLAVNVSPVQFRPGNLAESVIAALQSTRMPATRLELEITESVILQDNDANLGTLKQLREAGVRIVMDDFGAGYSSLSYLRKFQFDGLKVDRSLVSEALNSLECRAILQAVAGIAATLSISTTAEGVETVEQLQHVRSEGYTDAQGFLFGAWRTAHEIEEFMARSRNGSAVDATVEQSLPALSVASAR